MTNIIETPYVFEWLVSTLSDIAPGGAWESLAPFGLEETFITFNKQASGDENGVAGTRLWNGGLYQVKAVGLTSKYAEIITAANEIDDRLTKARATTEHIIIVHCVRVDTVAYKESATSGQEWSHLGGIYNIAAQPA